MPSISYAITACNEHVELERLLDHLEDWIREEDEVVIQLDTTATEEVKALCFDYMRSNWNVIEFGLNKDFASFKNNLKNHCTKDYIFQIDADENLSQNLILHLPEILELNPEIDLYAVPRINTVKGLTSEHINKWGWYINEKGWINYPDYQTRILKNIPEIKWINKVHERLVGAKIIVSLPEGYDLIHFKTIERQEKQNQFYNTL
jgi:cellulose synthase/poly-beta-1,6-N-acetylglucosamine synthase-like glycosyltransferase